MPRVLCQVCGDSIQDDRVCCSKCHAPHHRDCWDFNEGCSIFACGGTECWRAEARSDAGPEVVYIHESQETPRPEAARLASLRAPDVRWAVVGCLLLGFMIRGASDGLRSVPIHSKRQEAFTAVRRARPVREAKMVRDAVDPRGRIEIHRGTRVLVYPADPDGRHQIRTPSGLVRWVTPDYFQFATAVEALQAPSSHGIAQMTRDREGLPAGELVYLLRETINEVPYPGLNVRTTVFHGVLETGRFVQLGRDDFEVVRKPASLRHPSEAPAMLRDLRLEVSARRPRNWVILVDPASQSAILQPGVHLQVLRVESGPDGTPASYQCRLPGGSEATVPAASCRPLLARALRNGS